MSEDEQMLGGDAGESEQDIPEESAIDQRIVPFLGDELAAAMTAGGSIYITLPGICAALGLNVKGQMQRIKRTSSLVKGLRRIPLQTRGGTQSINCLRVDRVALWLAGIETSRVKPEYRAKIEAYQDELAPVAMQVFLRVAGLSTQQLIPADADPPITALAEQIDTLTDIVTFLREHMEALMAASGQQAMRLDQAISLLEGLAARQEATESQVARLEARTDHLTPAHARTIQEAVDRLVRSTKHMPSPLTHAILYGRLKHHFRVGSFREVPEARFDDVMAWLHDELARASSGEAPQQGSLF